MEGSAATLVDDKPVPDGDAAVRAAAEADTPEARAALTEDTRSAATAWFLDPDPDEKAFDWIEVNVGGHSPENPAKWVRFKMSRMDRDRIKEIRQECTRPDPNTGILSVDEMESNLRITTESFLDPDLSKPENRVVRGQTFMDPADAVRARFAIKSGLIDQIANMVVDFSGYNSADVREVKAAGN